LPTSPPLPLAFTTTSMNISTHTHTRMHAHTHTHTHAYSHVPLTFSHMRTHPSSYGVGYSLTMLVTPSSHPDDVLAFVREHVPQAKVQSNIGAELSILLPRTAAKYFPALLTALDGALERLGVRSYGITQVRGHTHPSAFVSRALHARTLSRRMNVALRYAHSILYKCE
jgi:hypothetical protein